ncbi:hypothetical protein GALMADRAFT_148734 [Galerina marginata CBS 339.88]|uniref:Uncharacterized protein n=1 Tax=Galerina marginata (strain CBS 339.88) TaxID=685588 RepID=A0A067S3H5_GALM3|nr:hypothetical protein GALMADRAFT_148734 [Galerina marginata CBS 339.88]
MCLQQTWNQLTAASDKYRLAQRLNGHQGAINCFAVVGDSELLASGGDDEQVIIWDLGNYKQIQVFNDVANKWGQITSLLWIPLENGRRRFIESSDTQVFSVGDSVEAIAFDPINYRFGTTSHQGKIKMFRLEKEELSPLWTVEQIEGIPRSAYFVNRGEEVVICTLESGEVACRDSQTAALKYTKRFKTAIGNVDVDDSQRNMVIDNMNGGFDVYSMQRSTPAQSFEIPTERRYTRDVVFGEKGTLIVGGSDHGRVYIFDLKSSTPAEVITHGKSESLIQAIITQSSEDRHLIISGSSDNNSSICIWQKPTKHALSRRKRKDVNKGETAAVVAVVITLILIYSILAFTWRSWVPALREELGSIHSKAKYLLEKPSYSVKQSKPIDVEALLKLDDRILRRILNVPELTERDLEAFRSKQTEENIVSKELITV